MTDLEIMQHAKEYLDIIFRLMLFFSADLIGVGRALLKDAHWRETA